MCTKEIIVIIIYSCLMDSVSAKLFTIEVENYATKDMRKPRSSASGDYSVLLLEGQGLNIDFCLRAETLVNIREISYSNDGFEDTVFTSIDGNPTGTFNSPLSEDDGNGWNQFRSTGPLQKAVSLRTGRHSLLLNVTKADKWGIEIDNVILDIGDEFMEYADLMCHLYCFDDIIYDEIPRKDSIPSGKFVQRSVRTQCAEQDNVHIDVYHENVREFEIVANLPKYVSFSNAREPQYDNCHLGSPYWIFNNISIIPGQTMDKSNANLQMIGSLTRAMILVNFDFDMLTESRELDERMIGSSLTMKLRNMPREDVRIRPEYKRHGAWIALPQKKFTPFSVEQSWNIPDRAWNANGQNSIRITVEPGRQTVILDSLSLKKQSSSDTTFDMYADPNIVIQGVRLGFWHHWNDQPNSMSISVANVEHKKVDSIRVYSKVAWTGGYSQTLVLFQDGRVRLQVITPHGLDYVPFGSSVFIGQPKLVNVTRPYMPIKSISIDPTAVRLIVNYIDGNEATFELRTTFTQTKLLVKDIYFKKNRSQFPVLTLKSMWINDGNSDVDHVTINGGTSRHVMSDWTELYGISAVFFRKCISKHNTQAPDMTVQFLSPTIS